MASEQLADMVAPDIVPEQDTPTSQDSAPVDAVDRPEPGDGFSIFSNAYGHYHVPDALADTDHAQSLKQAETPDSTTVQLITRKLGSGDLITGSTGVGAFLPAFHEALAPNAQIFGFEVDPVALRASQETVALNGLDRLNLHHAIAGKQDREIRSERLNMTNRPDLEKLPMRRLDNIVPEGRYVSVIHLNAYGRDMPAVIGAGRIIQDSMPMLVMKCDSEKQQRFYHSCLTAHYPDLDYRFAGMMDGNAIFLPLYRL